MKGMLDKAITVRSATSEIRKNYASRLKLTEEQWGAVTVALGALRDTCVALFWFEEKGFGNEIEIGRDIFNRYGFLQGLFLQQEAIQELKVVLTGAELSAGQAWSKIRDIRHMLVAHPIRRDKLNDRRSPLVRQAHIAGWGGSHSLQTVQIHVWKKDRYQLEEINLDKLLHDYKLEAYEILDEVLREILKKARLKMIEDDQIPPSASSVC